MTVTALLMLSAVVSGQVPVPIQPAAPQIIIINNQPFRIEFGQIQFEFATPQPGPQPATTNKKSEMKPGLPGDGPPAFEIRTTDESIIRVSILDSTLELTTSFGPLVIPVKDVRKLEIGVRLSDEESASIAAAINKLIDQDRKARVLGREAALAFAGKALPAVRRAKKGVADPEILAGLADLEGRLAAAMREKNEKEPIDRDTIHTEGSKFVGRLTASHVKVLTGAFGEQKLKVTDVQSARSLLAAPADEEGDLIVLPPNGMVMFQGQFGKVFRVRVTGVASGSIWGTGTYTLDSNLPMAAVHAGALKMGETGIVKVRIVQSPNQFPGGTQNGVTSGTYGQYPSGAYEVVTK